MEKVKLFITLVLMLVAGAAFAQGQKCTDHNKPCSKKAEYLEWKGMILEARVEARYERALHRQDTVKTTPVKRLPQQTGNQQGNRQSTKKEVAGEDDLPKGKWRYRVE